MVRFHQEVQYGCDAEGRLVPLQGTHLGSIPTLSTMNCLAYALQFWDKFPNYKLFYNSNHVINAYENVTGSGYLPAEAYGYIYFKSAFDGLLTTKEEQLLKKYFKMLKSK